MKIEIDGHGGHLCEAWSHSNGSLVGPEIGANIEEAIGRLIAYHYKELGIEIKVQEGVTTTAYDRSYCYDLLNKKKSEYSIWIEGCLREGYVETASFIASVEATSFQEACDKYFKSHKDCHKYCPEKLTFFCHGLFETELEARKSFG
jgi:hypothetical protein